MMEPAQEVDALDEGAWEPVEVDISVELVHLLVPEAQRNHAVGIQRANLAALGATVVVRVDPDQESVPDDVVAGDDSVLVAAELGAVVDGEGFEAVLGEATGGQPRGGAEELTSVVYLPVQVEVDPEEARPRVP